MEKKTEKEKNIIIMVKYISKENLKIIGDGMVLYIIKMKILNLK